MFQHMEVFWTPKTKLKSIQIFFIHINVQKTFKVTPHDGTLRHLVIGFRSDQLRQITK